MFRTIPPITKNLLIVNLLAYLLTVVVGMRGIDLADIGGLHFFLASDFHLFQFFSYMFLHANFTHLFFNMFALWMFGCVIENVWGQQKFLFYYIFCGVGAGLVQELSQWGAFYMELSSLGVGMGDMLSVGHQMASSLNGWNTVGASGAIYAILLAFGMLFPNERMFIIPFPFPIKAKYFVMGYVAIELVLAFSSPGDHVAHTAHLGGMLFGFLLIRYWNRHPSGFDRSRGQQFFDNMKRGFEQRRQQKKTDMHVEQGGRHETDMEYNARKRANQEEIDAILDKIRKSGYDSLTKEEKQKLFDASRER